MPLNSKMWGNHPSALNCDWASIEADPKSRMLRRLKYAKRSSTSYCEGMIQVGRTQSVRYPKGGTGVIWDGVAAKLSKGVFELNASVEQVDAAAKRLILQDGRTIRYKYLISTMPISGLLTSLIDQPDLRRRASEFIYSTVSLFGFGVEGSIPESFRGVHSFQVPEMHIPFWRVTIPSNVSPYSVPDAATHWSVLCEASRGNNESGSEVSPSDVEKGLRQVGLLTGQSRIVSRLQSEIKYGYPVPFVGRDELLGTVQSQLQKFDIFSRGRFGGGIRSI